MATKAQMQMGETIAVLVVFFFLLTIGLVFYVNIATSKAEESKYKNTELESINVMKRALSLPELQCSHNNIVDDACIDKYKLAAADMVIETSESSYFDLFGTSKITIIQVYPTPAVGAVGAITLYDYPIIEYSSRLNTSTPISIFDPISRSYAFGLMEIVTYGK